MTTSSVVPTSRTAARRIATLPNLLSIARLCSVPVFLWLFTSGREEAAVIVYGAGAWTDFFDGYIARRLDQVSALGQLLDPLADRVFIVALAVALVATDGLPLWLAIGIVARDVLLLSMWPLFERRSRVRIAVNFVGKTATACLLVGLTALAVSRTDWSVADAGEAIGLIFVIAGAVLYWVAAAMYAREAIQKLQPGPGRERT